jgi:hypothetical protein
MKFPIILVFKVSSTSHRVYEISYNFGIQSFLNFRSKSWLNLRLVKSLHPIQTKISSSIWQISDIITPEPLNQIWKSVPTWEDHEPYSFSIQVFLSILF